MNTHYRWTVIGAGPAGIATVGKLVDHGIDPQEIAWIDPKFKVGDFGQKWRNVSSNTKVSLFTNFLMDCNSFDYPSCSETFELSALDPSQTCLLKYAAEPLQWISQQLMSRTHAFAGLVDSLEACKDVWRVNFSHKTFTSTNVVLAYGAEPKFLSDFSSSIIPLEIALDKTRIADAVSENDIVAVIGASHSGVIAMRLLLEAGVKQVINFYQGELRYAADMGDWTLYDNTGLKGEAAVWARANLSSGNLPERLLRVSSNEANLNHYMATCTKSIHAVGFKARTIQIHDVDPTAYDRSTGIIAPGLFGIGIAFPEQTTDRYGNVELSVGLWKFMRYLNQVLPTWLSFASQ